MAGPEGIKCSTCLFYEAHVGYADCRRRSPKLIEGTDPSRPGMHAPVDGEEGWCGKWRNTSTGQTLLDLVATT